MGALNDRAGAATAGGEAEPAHQARLTGLLENLVTMGLRTTVQVQSLDYLQAPPEVAQALQLPVGALVQKAERVRRTREGPLSFITTWVPEAMARGFGRQELARKPAPGALLCMMGRPICSMGWVGL